jgi:hypothetical protein
MQCAFCQCAEAVHHRFQTFSLGFVSLCDPCWRASVGLPSAVNKRSDEQSVHGLGDEENKEGAGRSQRPTAYGEPFDESF